VTYRIPFNRAGLTGAELSNVAHAIEQGHLSGAGDFGKECEDLLQTELGVSRALLTTSCTHALEMAALLLGVGPGDEVIVPSFTFVSTANAFVLRGARPVFVDSRADTLNMDETRLESLITPRTKAIVPVHYAGVSCELDAILEIAARHGLAVIEDNAHGLFGRYKGRELGGIGDLGTLSFHETKNFTCGEGGALLINDAQYTQRAEILRDKGTDRSRFFRGEIDKYTWVDVGSSYCLSDILAAFLFSQLSAAERVRDARRNVWEYYDQHLAQWAQERGVRQPIVPAHCEQSHHMYYLLLPTEEARAALIAQLKGQGILSVFHYQPLHVSHMGQHFGGREGDCPVAEDVSRRLVRLPFYNQIARDQQDEVIAAVRGFIP
jgi:dTDP-4-amino-4,6-dideoxygalactose transaminase